MENRLHQIRSDIQRNCVGLQKEICELHKTLEEPRKEKYIESENQLMQEKLSQIQCELEVASTQQHVHNSDPLLVSLNLLQELTTLSSKVSQLLELHDAQLKTLGEASQNLDGRILCQEQLQQAMQQRLEVLENDTKKSPENEQDKLQQKLIKEKEECDKQVQVIREKMNIFMKKHFSPPSTKQRVRGASASIQDLLSQKKFVPLEKIIDDLVRLAVHKPEDPYLVLGLQHWPDHIEMLLKFDIACRHPSDIGRIRMSDMHL